MSVEFVSGRAMRSESVEVAVSDYISEKRSFYGEEARIDQLESENDRLRMVLSELIQALAGVLPNDVLTSLCGGSSRGFIRRNGSDGDVVPLEERLDDIDTVHQEVRILEDRFDDHISRRGSWAHDE
jgi:hypothetical protein